MAVALEGNVPVFDDVGLEEQVFGVEAQVGIEAERAVDEVFADDFGIDDRIVETCVVRSVIALDRKSVV